MALYALGWGTGRYLYEMSPTSCFYLTFAMAEFRHQMGLAFSIWVEFCICVIFWITQHHQVSSLPARFLTNTASGS